MTRKLTPEVQQLVFVTQKTDDSPHGKLMETVLAAIAQFDNDLRAEKVTGGLKKNAEQGRRVNKAPPGYRNNGSDSPSQKIDALAPIVRRAFQRIAAGDPIGEVRRDAEAEGVRGRSGKLSPEMFLAMLRNETYIGRSVTKHGNVPGDWEPIVDVDTFRVVQQRLRRRQTRASATRSCSRLRPEFPLKSHVLCLCGRPLTAYFATGRHGKRYGYYRCASDPRDRTPVCLTEVPCATVDTAFMALLDRIRPTPGYLRLYGEAVRRHWQQEQATLAERRDTALRHVADWTAKIDRMTERALLADDGTFDPGTVRRLREQLEARRRDAEATAEELDVQTIDAEAIIAFAEHVCLNAGRLWDALSPGQRKQLGDTLFPSGIVFDGAELLTPELGWLFNDLRGTETERQGLVDLTGIEPVTS